MTEIPIFSSVLTDPAGRRENEDAVYSCEQIDANRLAKRGRLYIVADGTGGQPGGGTASAHAIKVASDTFYEGSNGTDNVGDDLCAAVQAAHRSLHRLAQDAPSWKELSTTIVAAVVHGDQLYVAHVGDSRAYLVRGNKVRQITRDHVWEEDDEQFGSLTRWLGGAEHPTVEVDLTTQPLQGGDVVILATDGLTGHVDEDEMLPVVSARPVHDAARILIELSKHHGTRDNSSIAIVRYGGARIEAAAARQKVIWIGAGVVAAIILLALGVLAARSGGNTLLTATPNLNVGSTIVGITVIPELANTAQPVAPGIATKTPIPLGPTATRQATDTPAPSPVSPARGTGVSSTSIAPVIGGTPHPCPGNQVWNGKGCACPTHTVWVPEKQWCADTEKGGGGGEPPR